MASVIPIRTGIILLKGEQLKIDDSILTLLCWVLQNHWCRAPPLVVVLRAVPIDCRLVLTPRAVPLETLTQGFFLEDGIQVFEQLRPRYPVFTSDDVYVERQFLLHLYVHLIRDQLCHLIEHGIHVFYLLMVEA